MTRNQIKMELPIGNVHIEKGKYFEPITIATIAAAVIGAGASVYSADQAADAQKEAQDKADKARREAEARAKKETLDIRPEGETATMIPGSGEEADASDYNSFLTPKQTAMGGAGGSGLGFGV